MSRFFMSQVMPHPWGDLRPGASGPRIATLRDSNPDPPPRHHASDDEDEDEPGRDQGESWFAGGERRFAFTTPSIQSYL